MITAADPADTIFEVNTAEPIGAEFDEVFMISTAEPAFIVRTSAVPADQIFDVFAGHDVQIVTVGPDVPTPGGILPVTVVQEFKVTASI